MKKDIFLSCSGFKFILQLLKVARLYPDSNYPQFNSTKPWVKAPKKYHKGEVEIKLPYKHN